MNLKLLLTLTVLVTVPFAGCMSDDEPSQDGDDRDVDPLFGGKDNFTVDENGTLVEKGSPLDDASVDGNGTDPGMRAHKHDYWGDRTEVVLVDGEYNPNFCFRGRNAMAFSMGCFEVGMGNGSIVYPGTARLTVFAEWSDPKVTGLSFTYRDVVTAHEDPIVLQSGVAHEIPVDLGTADLAHTKESAWAFRFQGQGTGLGVAMAPIHVVITIYRGLDLQLDAAHPDFWANGTTVRDLGAVSGTLPPDQGGWLAEDTREPIRPAEGQIIPPGTELLEVHFSWQVKDPANGVRYDVYPLWKSAKNSWYRFPDQAEIDPGQREGTFYVFVEPDMTDSPYATLSQWGFLLHTEYREATTGFPLFVVGGAGPNPFARDIDYNFHFIAYKESFLEAPEEEDWDDDRAA